MKWNKVYDWYKKPNGECVKFKIGAVKADDKLVDKSWTALDTCPSTGGYLESSPKKQEPAKKADEKKSDK